MKKAVLLGIAVFLLSFIFAGCSTDSSPDSMTFVDNIADPSREFTIDENMRFTVKFIKVEYLFSVIDPEFDIDNLDEDQLNELEAMGIIAISGVVRETNNTWTSAIIMGTAQNMYSNSPEFTELVDGITVDIVLSYEPPEGEITAINVAFADPTGTNLYTDMSTALMGGRYIRR